MSQVRFLIDENLRLSTVAALRRAEPSLDVHRVGQADMPRFGAADDEILRFCAASRRILVTLDRATIPTHVSDYLSGGGHTSGVLLVTSRCTFGRLIDDLLLIWSCSTDEEWIDSVHYLPLNY